MSTIKDVPMETVVLYTYVGTDSYVTTKFIYLAPQKTLS